MTDVTVTDQLAVRSVVLHRPESKNGLTVETTRELAAAIRAPEAIRVIVAGAGGAFCSGLDLKAATKHGLPSGPDVAQALREGFHELIRALVDNPRPTIAAIDG